jgi:hypothetical protein
MGIYVDLNGKKKLKGKLENDSRIINKLKENKIVKTFILNVGIRVSLSVS